MYCSRCHRLVRSHPYVPTSSVTSSGHAKVGGGSGAQKAAIVFCHCVVDTSTQGQPIRVRPTQPAVVSSRPPSSAQMVERRILPSPQNHMQVRPRVISPARPPVYPQPIASQTHHVPPPPKSSAPAQNLVTRPIVQKNTQK